MILGSFKNNPVLNQKEIERKTGLRYTVSDQVDENGAYVIEYDGDIDEFFRKLGYHRAEDVEKEFLNIQNENDK